MKFLWRLGAAALVSVLLVSLAGCTSGARPGGNDGSETSATSSTTPPPPDVRTLFQEIDATMDRLTSLDADFSLRMTTILGESSLVTNMSGNLRMAGLPDKPVFTADITTSSMGQSVSLSLYYADKMLYLAGKDAYMDSKIKVPVPTDDSGDADEETAALLEEKIKPKLEKILESAAVVEKGGDAQVTLTIPSADLWDLAEILAAGMPEDTFSGDLDLSEQPELSDMKVTLTIDSDRYLTEMLMEGEITAPMQTEDASSPVSSEPTTIRLSFSTKLNHPGEPAEVTPPADLDAYQEQPTDDEGLWEEEFSGYELL